mgnify:CR=1 FL=1
MSAKSTSRSSAREPAKPEPILPLLKEKSRLEAQRLKREKRILLEQMIRFTDAAEKQIAGKLHKSQKHRSSLDVRNESEPYHARARLLKDLKIVKEFAKRKIPKPSHYKKLQHLYPHENLSETHRSTHTGRSSARASTSRSSSRHSARRIDRPKNDQSGSRTSRSSRNDMRSLGRTTARSRTSATSRQSTARSHIQASARSTHRSPSKWIPKLSVVMFCS